MNIRELRKIIRQESPTRLELGVVTAADNSGIRNATVRLSGGRSVTRIYMVPESLDVGDRVIIAHMVGLDRMVVIGRILDEYETNLSRSSVLTPAPPNFTVTGVPMGVEARWDSTPGRMLYYEVERAPDSGGVPDTANSETVLISRGSYYTHLCTVHADHSAETWHFRIRSLYWVGNNNVMYSAWTDWAYDASLTWDARFYREDEISSHAVGDGASLVWIADVDGNYDADVSNVELALAGLAAGTAGVSGPWGHVIIVAKSGALYNTVQAGLTAASGGDLVVVMAGEWEENVTVSADSVDLMAAFGMVWRVRIAGSDDVGPAVSVTAQLSIVGMVIARTLAGGSGEYILVDATESDKYPSVLRSFLQVDGYDLGRVVTALKISGTASAGAGITRSWITALRGASGSSAVKLDGGMVDISYSDIRGDVICSAATELEIVGTTIDGDLTGVAGSTLVMQDTHVTGAITGWDTVAYNDQMSIGGEALSTTSPTEGQVLKWILDADGCPGALCISEFWAPSELCAADICIEEIGAATYDNIQDWINNTQSAGRISGGTMTAHAPADGTLDVAAGTGLIKTSASDIGVSKFFDWGAASSLALADGECNYIYVDYNTGTGAVTVAATTTRSDIDGQTEFTLGRVCRDGNDLYIAQSGMNVYNHAWHNHQRLVEVRGFEQATGGVIAETGQRYLAATAGKFFLGANPIITAAQDTSGAERFTHWQNDGSWQKTTGQQQLGNTQYNDYGTGLASLTAPEPYGVYWVFIRFDGDIHVIYGIDKYKLADAEDAVLPPNIPDAVSCFGALAAKIIFERNENNLTSIASAYDTVFPVSGPVNHNDLGGLQGGTADEYYHTTSAQHTATFGNKTANQLYAGPVVAPAAAPAFRALVDADIPVAIARDTEVTTDIATHTAITDAHHDPVTLAASADELLGLSTQALSLDAQSVGEVLSGPLSGGDAAPTFKHLGQVGVAAGLGDVLFTKDDGLLLLGPGCPISPTKWETLRGQDITLSGAFHQEQGRWPGTRGLVVEEAGLNYEPAPRMIEAGATGLASGWTYTDNLGSGGDATKDIVVHPITERGWLQRLTYTAVAGDAGDHVRLEDYTAVGSFAQGDDVTISFDAKGFTTGCDFVVLTYETDAAGVNGTAHASSNFTLLYGLSRFEYTFTTVDADCSKLYIQIRVANVDNGDSFDVWFGAVNCEKADHTTSFMHGGSSWCVWSGAADDSTTTRTVTEANLDAHVGLISDNDTLSFSMCIQMFYDHDQPQPAFSALMDTRGADNNNRIQLYYDPGADVFNVYINGAIRLTSAVQSFLAGDWIVALVTCDFADNTHTLSLQGVLEDTDTTVLAAPTLTEWNVASSYDGEFPGGVLSEYTVLDRIVTADEDAVSYALGKPLVDAGALTPPLVDGRWVRLPISTDNVSNPPTEAELDIAFGWQPDGFAGLVDDNGAGTTIWKVERLAGKWWHWPAALTAAA